MNQTIVSRNSVRIILALMAIFILSINLHSKEIHSTKEGGDWSDKETWVNGTVPNQGDNVVINSTVKVTKNTFCDSLTVELDCKLHISENMKLICSDLVLKKEDKRFGTIVNMGIIEVGDDVNEMDEDVH